MAPGTFGEEKQKKKQTAALFLHLKHLQPHGQNKLCYPMCLVVAHFQTANGRTGGNVTCSLRVGAYKLYKGTQLFLQHGAPETIANHHHHHRLIFCESYSVNEELWGLDIVQPTDINEQQRIVLKLYFFDANLTKSIVTDKKRKGLCHQYFT